MLITIDEAAAVLQMKSRGSLYRKINEGALPVVVDASGAKLIERDGLETLWARISRRKHGIQAATAGSAEAPPCRRGRKVEDGKDPPVPPATGEPQDATPESPPDYYEQRAWHEYEKRLTARNARLEDEKQLLRREDVERGWGRAVNMTRTKLLGVPSRAKQRIPHLEPDEVEIIMDLIREALDELSAGEVAT